MSGDRGDKTAIMEGTRQPWRQALTKGQLSQCLAMGPRASHPNSGNVHLLWGKAESSKVTGGVLQGSLFREELRQVSRSLCDVFQGLSSSIFLPLLITGVGPLASVSSKAAPLNSFFFLMFF